MALASDVECYLAFLRVVRYPSDDYAEMVFHGVGDHKRNMVSRGKSRAGVLLMQPDV